MASNWKMETSPKRTRLYEEQPEIQEEVVKDMPLPKPRPEAWQQSVTDYGEDLDKLYKEQQRENKVRVFEHLNNRGLRDEAIAAIMANIEVETGGSFSPAQAQTKSGKARDQARVRNGGTGLFQFDDYAKNQGHKTWYKEYLKDTGKEDSVESQLDYFIDGVYSDSSSPLYKYTKRFGAGDAGVLKQYLEVQEDPRIISDAIVDRFEKAGIPHSGRRRDASDKYFNEIKQGEFKRGFLKKFFGGYNEGGMVKQMSMFDDGGLLQEGGSVDPISGNDVPVGSTKEEVRDDIPAQLSEGEFVFPADVVRYHGLDKMMALRDEAKAGLARMDAMGQMGNSEEATIPDGIPFNMEDLIMEEVAEYQVGGYVPGTQQVGSYLSATPTGIQPTSTGQGTFASLQTTSPYSMQAAPTGQQQAQIPTTSIIPQGETELRQYINDQGQMLTIAFVGGKPVYPIPAGYKPYVEGQQAAPVAPPVTATPAPAPRQQDSGDDGQQDTFGQGATAVFGGTSQNGLIQGGTTYELGYERSGLDGAPKLPGLLGLVTGGFDQVTLTDASGRKATMSKDMYNTLTENRTSAETTSIIENLFNKSDAARAAVEGDPQFDTGFLGTGMGGNRKELDSKMARQLMVDSGLDYKGQSLAEAMILSDEVIARAGPATQTTPTTIDPDYEGVVAGEAQRIAETGFPTTGVTVPEVSLTTTSTTPRPDATNAGGSDIGFGALANTRPATAGDVARLSGMADVKIGQMLTPVEMQLSDERTMQRVDAPTQTVQQIEEFPVFTVANMGGAFDDAEGKKYNKYAQVGDDLIRVKPDGTLSSDPASNIDTYAIRNRGRSVVGEETAQFTRPVDMPVPLPRPDREQLERDRIFAEETGSAQADVERRERERLERDIQSNRARQDALQTIREAESAQREEQNRRAAEEETAQRNQVRQRAEERAEQQRDAQAGRGNIVTSSSGRPVTDRSGNAVTTTAGSKVDRETIEKQADAMRAEAAASESNNDSGGNDSKIVCTEMYRQTQLDDWAKAIKIWDVYQKRYLTPYHEVGYHWLFKPYVKGMQNSNMLTKFGAYLAQERTKHLRHVLTKGKAQDSLVGNLWCKFIHPIVYVAGRIK